MPPAILALDQGTTSSRAMLFDRDGPVLAVAQHELPQIYPAPGEVEHDPEEIWRTQLAAARAVLAQAGPGVEVAAIGIANQRETTLVWERESGRPVGNAIVWQSRVSEPICRRLREAGHEERIRAKTGLVVDPYFSGTKLQHLLESISGLRQRAERGEVLFGTVDSFLVWRLTGGRHHVTDVSNASRTLLFDLDALDWDDELLDLFGVPRAMLPEVRPTSAVYGETAPELLGVPLPIGSVVGDQQAATFGQACFAPGEAKNTYGTGAFLLVNTGTRPVRGARGLLATVGWQLGEETVYCLEGSVFVAGAVVQWLRDGLGLVASAGEVEALARRAQDSGGVFFVPAFVGLGAPYWDQYARGLIIGLTRNTSAAHIARAAVESMAFQTRDLLEAMQQDAGITLSSLKVDGGATVNNRLLEFQADLLGVPVRRPAVGETTALGAAYLAGLAVGYWNDLDDVRRNWVLDREFAPAHGAGTRDRLYRRWKRAVERCRQWEEDRDTEA
jgi:glycerol kinase